MEAFENHLPRIEEFWKSQLLGKEVNERFDLIKGHEYLKIRKGELDRWVILFIETLNEVKVQFEETPDIDSFSKMWEEKIKNFQKTFKKLY